MSSISGANATAQARTHAPTSLPTLMYSGLCWRVFDADRWVTGGRLYTCCALTQSDKPLSVTLLRHFTASLYCVTLLRRCVYHHLMQQTASNTAKCLQHRQLTHGLRRGLNSGRQHGGAQGDNTVELRETTRLSSGRQHG